MVKYLSSLHCLQKEFLPGERIALLGIVLEGRVTFLYWMYQSLQFSGAGEASLASRSNSSFPKMVSFRCTVMHRVEMCMYFCFKVFLKKLWVLVNNQKVLSSCRKGILLKVGQNETANFFFFNVWNTKNAWTTTPPFKITIKRQGINCDAGFPRTAKCCLR